MTFHSFKAKGIEVAVDLRVGHLRRLVVTVQGRALDPLHTAPWVEDAAITGDETIAPNVRFLSGDFFCAPFGRNDIEDGPSHGATANSPWTLEALIADPDGATARYELQREIMGARVFKELRLRDGHPFLYERHVFQGGEGGLPVANHAMTRIAGTAGLSFSRKAFGLTPQTPLESDPLRGRSALAYPTRFETLEAVGTADGGRADLTRYPFAQRHEDFVMLVEGAGNRLGWAAVSRHEERDIVVSLKDPAELPFTFLWVSNGGRDYRPWNGRHVGVLGVEDARSFGGYGHRASAAANPFSQAGIPTALVLDPGGSVFVRNVIGVVPLPEHWERVADIRVTGNRLTLIGLDGAGVSYPYDASFLGG